MHRCGATVVRCSPTHLARIGPILSQVFCYLNGQYSWRRKFRCLHGLERKYKEFELLTDQAVWYFHSNTIRRDVDLHTEVQSSCTFWWSLPKRKFSSDVVQDS